MPKKLKKIAVKAAKTKKIKKRQISAKAKTVKKLPVKLIKYLEKHGVKHEILEHKTVYTAFDVAATMRKRLNEIAKSLLVKADRDYYLIILPADNKLNFFKLGRLISKQTGKPIKAVKIPGEKIMENALKIKAGAISAFGGLHKLPVVMDNALIKTKKAIFASGSFNHSVEMAVEDFIKMENVILGSFGCKKKVKVVRARKAVKKNVVVKKRRVVTKRK